MKTNPANNDQLQGSEMPKRRWYQYSLRRLFVLATLICVVLAIVVPGERQRRAVVAIKISSGQVTYDGELDGAGQPALAWYERLLGVDYFRSVVRADLSEEIFSPIHDERWAVLRELPALQFLNLDNTSIGDAALEHLHGLSELEVLYLENTPVGDAGLKCLRNMLKLKSLYLNKTDVTDAGLANLRDCSRLEVLNLNDTHVGDAGLAHLRGLSSLRWWSLYGTQVSPAGIAELRAVLPQCRIYGDAPK